MKENGNRLLDKSKTKNIQKKKVIPGIYERSFAYLFDQNEDLLAYFISHILKIEYTLVMGKIRKLSNNAQLNHKKAKKRQMDFVYRIDNLKIDIELNLRAKVVKDRNLDYLSSLHSKQRKKGEKDNIQYETIQININNEMIYPSEDIVDEYFFMKKGNVVYSYNMGIYVINVPLIRKLWYNNDIEELKKNKFLVPLIIEETSRFRKIFNGDKIMEDILDKMEKFSSDNEEWETFRSENEYEELYQKGLEIAKKDGVEEGISQGISQGIEQGISQGIEQGIEQTARNMLKEGMDISLISKITNLSEEQIVQIKNSKQ